ncbi:MAG: hypothetical protein P8189_30415 [Anaerolineae bacterium]
MNPSRFFWTAHPAWAMLEAWLLGLLILLLLSLQVGIVVPAVLSNGLLFLCGACGMWAVLRTRLPRGNWLRQGLWELAVGLALSLVMAAGVRVPAVACASGCCGIACGTGGCCGPSPTHSLRWSCW